MASPQPRVLKLERIYPAPEPERDTGRPAEPIATLDHVDRVIRGPVRLLGPDGQVLLSAVRLGNTDRVREVLSQEVKYPRAGRSTGLVSRSKTFGYAPRLVVRKHEACRASAFTHEYPEAAGLLVKAAEGVDRIYSREIPSEHAKHRAEIDEKVHPAWCLGSSVFTSGIINKNTALHYHLDRGNFPDRWSCMLTFKHRLKSGGAIVFPQWRIAHACDDGLLLIFNGQHWWHGVTPMEVRKGGFRITVVFYSLRQMWQCLEPTKELERARRKRTERESHTGERVSERKRTARERILRQAKALRKKKAKKKRSK